MADTPAGWSLSAATNRGDFQATVGAAPYGIVTNTNRLDVSEQLDLLALSETPFINKIGWGPESGGVSIRWISEDLGPGVITNLSNIVTAGLSIMVGSIDGLQSAGAAYQVQSGTVLYSYSSCGIAHTLFVVASIDTDLTITLSCIVGVTMSVTASVLAGGRQFVLGHHVNEGSKASDAKPRQRVVTSNNFVILREDVAISGSMKATDMYAIGREDKHQIAMRMKELVRAREMVSLFSDYQSRDTAEAGQIFGVLGFLLQQTGSHIDGTTRILTETAFNDVVGTLWDYGSENLSVWASRTQIAKFTQWDKNRIRQTVNEGKGGGYIKSYLTEAGVEVTLHPGRINWPRNLMFILDTSKIKLRAKKGRKGFMEKLGKAGDSDDWQILTEFSLEMKGYDLKQHGMFHALTAGY